MTSNQKLDLIVEKCKDIMAHCDLKLPENITYSLNGRYTRKMGCCERLRFAGYTTYKIEFAKCYFEAFMAANEERKMEETVLHEMCHTLPNCMNHGIEWQLAVHVINELFGYNIGQYTKCDAIINSVKASKGACKELYCTKCGMTSIVKANSAVVKNPWRYTCRCGNKLEIREVHI